MRENILLITVDSLRADFVSPWNKNFKSIAPNLHKIAEESVVFKNAFSHSSHTRCSFASLFTSKYPSEKTYPVLSGNYITMAKILKDAGYRTVGIHSNPFLSKPFGYTDGFDILEDTIYPWKSEILPKKFHLILSRILRIVGKQPYLSAEGINKKVFKYLNDIKEPFFLWIHYMDVHGPYQSKKGFSYFNKMKGEILWQKALKLPHLITQKERSNLVEWYKEEIFYFDNHFGKLIDLMKRKSFFKNTMLIFCSDHGDAFYEHGFYRHERFLYDELLHVPLLIRHPDMDFGEIDELVGLVDILPTILDILDIKKEYKFDGESLLPLIKGRGKKIKNFIIADTTLDDAHPHICIRTAEWKLIINENNKKYELYNLKDDPEEKNNLYGIEKEKVRELKEILKKYYSFEKQQKTAEEPDIDEEVARRLKDLGYF